MKISVLGGLFFLSCLLSVSALVLPGLMYEEEGVLLEIMMCAIRQAAEATRPVGRSQGKKVPIHSAVAV